MRYPSIKARAEAVPRLFLACAALVCALFAAAAPAQAQGLRYFYCYAVDAKVQKVFVSDMHDVGPPAERAAYGEQFADYLKARGHASAAVQAYCVMRASEGEIRRGITDLPRSCRECEGLDDFTPVAWLRQGKGLTELLAGKLVAPEQPKGAEVLPSASSDSVRAEASVPPGASPDSPVKGRGVFIRVRMDMTDVVYSANEKNGDFLTRHKAQLKGGRWQLLDSDNRCPGWMAVAYASNGTERQYYVSQGAASEGEASRQALDDAVKTTQYHPGTWITGVLAAFYNDYQPDDAARGSLRQLLTEGCPAPRSGSSIGVRG